MYSRILLTNKTKIKMTKDIIRQCSVVYLISAN